MLTSVDFAHARPIMLQHSTSIWQKHCSTYARVARESSQTPGPARRGPVRTAVGINGRVVIRSLVPRPFSYAHAREGKEDNYTPARALEFDLHVSLSGCG